MNNSVFSLPRFWNVVRWDFTINRKFYTRVALMIACIVLVPILFHYIMPLYDALLGNTQALNAMTGNESQVDWWGGGMFIQVFWGVLSFFSLGCVFHSLMTRQGRIAELTLPATHLEKMLSHMLLVLVGTQVVFALSVVVADLLHVVLGWLIYHQTDFKSITTSVYSIFDVRLFGPTGEFKGSGWGAFVLRVLFTMMSLSFFATFVLGNAIKYRYNIVLTICCHIVFNLAMTVLLGLGVSVVGHINVTNFFNYLGQMPDWVGNSIVAMLALLSTLLFCCICYLTYYYYKRAQITSKLNP